MNEKLKPCPFCGNEFPTLTKSNTEGIRIRCPQCEIAFTRDFYVHRGELGRTRTIEAWNRRTGNAEILKTKALEKQMPRKPQDKFSTHAIIDNGEYIDNIDIMTFECPVCNGVLATGDIEKGDCTDIHYCENCGQAIDWSDEE